MKNTFLTDVLQGLSENPKHLSSKYFYDETGDRLFQEIMHSPEYYLTNCEYEILSLQCKEICEIFIRHFTQFDLVELGAGDCFKSKFLLKELVRRKTDFTYYPIDISASVINNLTQGLPKEIPGLRVQGLNGEYINMLEKSYTVSKKPKILLFLGANIGNMEPLNAHLFLERLKGTLQKGDLLLVGFDLKKNPDTILAAYNDKAGLTRAFNLNLLKRINTELGANFDTSKFCHYPCYNPISGACKSYLISLQKQDVYIQSADKKIHFERFEPISTEISQKYSEAEIESLLMETGFEIAGKFNDCKHWFADYICRVSD